MVILYGRTCFTCFVVHYVKLMLRPRTMSLLLAELSSSGGRKSINTDTYHIAFGTKIPVQRKLHKEVRDRLK